MLRRTARILSPLVLALAGLGLAHAAELGEARVASHIGQQLVADIELTMLEDAASPVGVRLASPEVYNGAGLKMPPVLASLNLSVMRRDGRQFLHVTSLRPVDSEHLHLYLELSDKGQRVVRLATLWLTPDPNPAPVQAPAPAPAPARVEPAPLPAAAVAAAPAPVIPAPRPRAVLMQRPAPHPMPVVPVEPDAEAVHAAPPSKPARIARPEPAAKPAQLAEKPKAAAGPAPLSPHKAEAPPCAACAPRAEAKVCAALDYKNAELKEQIGSLEDKVKVLQVALGASPSKVAAETPAAPSGPKPISAIKPLAPRKPKAPPPEEGASWGWIAATGVALLGLAGGAALVLRRRGKSRNVDIPATPGVLERLKQRFAARTKAVPEPGPEAAEPTLE